MINYEKIEDIPWIDIITDHKEEYAFIFKFESQINYITTLKEFCKKYLDSDFPITRWDRCKRLKYEYVEKYLIPYLIKMEALVPSVNDSLNYALIKIPGLNKKWSERPHNAAKVYTIKKIGEIYFDDNGEIIERGKNDVSNNNVQNMINFYNYAKMCADCDHEWLRKVENTLKSYGIINDGIQNVQ